MSKVKMLARKKLYDFAQEKGAMPGYTEGGPVDPKSNMGKAFSSIRGSFNKEEEEGHKKDHQEDHGNLITEGYEAVKSGLGLAHGGRVMEDESEDEMWGEYSPHNSSGEPHTNDFLEDEHPMEYMSTGGTIRGSDENFVDMGAEDQMMPDMESSPHTMLEDEDEMKKACYGGKMSAGGMVNRAFAHAIKRHSMK